MSQSVETYSRASAEEWREIIAAPHEDGGRDGALPQSDEMTPGADEAMERPIYTAGKFREVARHLEALLRHNPQAEFDAAEWLNNPDGDDSSALYARTLDGLGEDESKPLNDEELQVFSHLIAEAKLNEDQLKAHINQKKERASIEPENIREAREYQEEKRMELAELYAKRQKRMMGVDFMNSYSNVGKQALHFTLAKQRYEAATQMRIAQEINGGHFDSYEAMDNHIAMRTIQLAHELTNNITMNYGKNNRLLGKAINFMAGRKENGEPETSSAKKWGRRVLSYGIIPGAFAVGTVATGGSLAVVGAAGVWTGAKVYSVFETKHRQERAQRTKGLLSSKVVKSRINNTLDMKLDPQDQHGEKFVKLNELELVGSKIGRAVWAITNAVEEDTTEQQKKRLVRVLGSTAAGAAIAFGGHYLGAWLHGNNPDAGSVQSEGAHPNGIDSTQLPQTTPANPNISGGLSTISAHSNEGWYEVMKDMNINAAQRQDILLRAAPALYKYHLAYQMPDGLPGIPSVGNIPKLAVDILNYAAGR
ncbi:MAG: hypothetical protein H6797_05620 [Candidatus Nomurabacteria bacterium]|nr:MAG: hypothetical protein H6797_05620 [Candidatus Nomurabacteria bacterium]